MIRLLCAQPGPWWDGELNPELFEAVLGYSRARGPARLLLAAWPVSPTHDGTLDDVATDELRLAAGLADRTYRRLRVELLGSGELVLCSGGGGRGRTNRWIVPDPHELGAAPADA